MNALTYAAEHEAPQVSRSDPQVAPAAIDHAEKLRPARGLVIGLLLSVGFWVAVGLVAYLAFGR